MDKPMIEPIEQHILAEILGVFCKNTGIIHENIAISIRKIYFNNLLIGFSWKANNINDINITKNINAVGNN